MFHTRTNIFGLFHKKLKKICSTKLRVWSSLIIIKKKILFCRSGKYQCFCEGCVEFEVNMSVCVNAVTATSRSGKRSEYEEAPTAQIIYQDHIIPLLSQLAAALQAPLLLYTGTLMTLILTLDLSCSQTRPCFTAAVFLINPLHHSHCAKDLRKKKHNKNTESVERHEDKECRWKYLVKVERCGGQRRKGGKNILLLLLLLLRV